LYFEVTLSNCGGAGGNGAGIGSPTSSAYLGSNTNSIGYRDDGQIVWNNTNLQTMPSFTTGPTILQVAVDIDSSLFWAKRTSDTNWNNSGTANPVTGTGGIGFTITKPAGIIVALYDGSPQATAVLNTGASSFTGTKPTGFSAWNS